jgi:hypothetical protein
MMNQPDELYIRLEYTSPFPKIGKLYITSLTVLRFPTAYGGEIILKEKIDAPCKAS